MASPFEDSNCIAVMCKWTLSLPQAQEGYK